MAAQPRIMFVSRGNPALRKNLAEEPASDSGNDALTSHNGSAPYPGVKIDLEKGLTEGEEEKTENAEEMREQQGARDGITTPPSADQRSNTTLSWRYLCMLLLARAREICAMNRDEMRAQRDDFLARTREGWVFHRDALRASRNRL